MWSPPDVTPRVSRAWLRRRGLEDGIEDLALPNIYEPKGLEGQGFAVATISSRVLLTAKGRPFACSREGDFIIKEFDERGAPDEVWLGDGLVPSPAMMQRVMQKRR